jgi:hypothetical protein
MLATRPEAERFQRLEVITPVVLNTSRSEEGFDASLQSPTAEGAAPLQAEPLSRPRAVFLHL